ncbi:MAG: hypothetical protein K0Q79_1517 [Flavipsychrobacter sp.]|jgi:hypothetical protein|nr:hypothetical protein [Flavipsychrobacter sp.]
MGAELIERAEAIKKEEEKIHPGATIISSYKDLNISESDFKLAFGSVKAYNMQVNSKLVSTHGYLVPFVGAKAFWADDYHHHPQPRIRSPRSAPDGAAVIKNWRKVYPCANSLIFPN